MFPIKYSLRALFGFAGLLGFSLATPIQAQGDLLIAPTRVVMNGGGSSQVILSNIGSKAATYRISLELRRMLPDGGLEDIAEASANPTESAALGHQAPTLIGC